MSKNIIIVVLLLISIVAGIRFAALHNSDIKDIRLVEAALVNFAQSASAIEQSLLLNQQLKLNSSVTNLPIDETDQFIQLTTTITNERVTLRFGVGDSEVANRTLVLTPHLVNDRVRWKCLEGSVLLRLRPKPCGLGKKISLDDL